MTKPQTRTYRTRSSAVEAVQVDEKNLRSVASWLGSLADVTAETVEATEGAAPSPEQPDGVPERAAGVRIETPAGDSIGASIGDWVIRDTDGNLSTCSAAAFDETFEPATTH